MTTTYADGGEFNTGDAVEVTARQSSKNDSGENKILAWADCIPVEVTGEDSMSPSDVSIIWNKMYNRAGITGENNQKMLRAGFYFYCCKNGSSRDGDYNGKIKLAGGTTVDAALLPQCAGKLRIRKFMRGNMRESYYFLKDTGCMEMDERFVARAAKFGVAAENAFAMADWFADCALFTPAESKAHEIAFAKSIERAKRARGGHTLEEVEEERIDKTIQANGPSILDSHNEW